MVQWKIDICLYLQSVFVMLEIRLTRKKWLSNSEDIISIFVSLEIRLT